MGRGKQICKEIIRIQQSIILDRDNTIEKLRGIIEEERAEICELVTTIHEQRLKIRALVDKLTKSEMEQRPPLSCEERLSAEVIGYVLRNET